MSDLTGQQLSNYRLTQLLGSGAFGDVYQGENIFLGNLVAIKLLHTRLEGENARKFLFEAQTLVRLSHQHIIRVIDFRIERGRPMLIMDYVQGGSLRQKHKRGSLLPLELVVYYVKQIAEALQFAHNQRIIHQDVKPENVLMDAEQHLYLSDFGLAVTTSSTGSLAIQPEGAGTPQYMAPEQWQKHPTVFSDQYSLAIMAYEWLCGKRPFEGSGIAFQHVFEQPQPLRELCPELPEAVEQVVLRGLAKVPEQRFVSVRAFALALERASLEEITEVPPGIKPGGKTPPDAPDENKTPVQRKLFIAAASADKLFAEKVTADLQKRDIKFTYDPRAHLKQEEVLREAIRASSLVMIVASPQMRTSQTIREQLRIALLYKRQLVFVWARGENIAASLLDLAGKTEPIDVIDARDGRYETALDEIVDCLQEDPSLTPVAITPPISLHDEPRNPYKGLRPFSGEDASDFFGRDTLVQHILERLEKMLNPRRPVKYQQRLLTVVGPSGSGKSSVVMAGVLPKLQRGAITGSEKWCYVETMVPGQHPCDRLLSILGKQFPQKAPTEVRTILAAENGYGLYQLASILSGLTNRRVVLCVDQFEELFAVGVPEAERQHFLKLLMTAMTEPESPLVVILTLRADFYDRPMHHRQLAALITANQVSVLPMDNDELRAAIERPATQEDVQLFFEGDLVGDLLFELHGQEGALPLLEFTLEQLFQQRQGHLLTYGAYQAIGGLRGALARHADDVYDGLPSDEHRKLVQTLFLRLVDPGKSEQDTTRRRMVASELLFEDEQQTRLMNDVAHSFISARLLTTTMMAGVTSVEVSHEALIREWPRLAIWLRDAREDIVLQHTITNDAAIWQKTGQAADRLYRGVELGEAVRWLGRNKGNVDEVAFVRAGEAEEERRKMVEEQRLKEKLRLEKRAVQRLRGFVVALLLLLVVSIVSTLYFLNVNQTITNQNYVLEENAIASSADSVRDKQPDLAALLAVKATQIMPNAVDYQARNSLFQVLRQNPQLTKVLDNKNPMNALAFTNNGQKLLTAYGNAAYQWDTISGKETPLHLQKISEYFGSTAFSPDERFMLHAYLEGVELWDIQTGKLKLLSGPIPYALNIQVSFSSDGQFAIAKYCMLSSSQDTSVCTQTEISVWDVNTTKLIGRPLDLPDNITAVSISSASAVAALAGPSGIQLWNASTDQQPNITLPGSTNVTSLAFSPHGDTIVSGDETGTIKFWSTTTTKLLYTSSVGHTGAVNYITYNANGAQVASSGADTTVKIWEAQNGQLLLNLTGDNKEKTAIAFSLDGTRLATTSQDGQIMLWDLTVDSPITQRMSELHGWRNLLFDPTGKTVFSGSESNITFQQNITDGKIIHQFPMNNPLHNWQDPNAPPSSGVIQSLGLSKTGNILATGRDDGTISIWQTASETLLNTFQYPGPLYQLALSSDGDTLFASGTQGLVIGWDNILTKKAQQILRIQTNYHTETPIALNPKGQTIAVGDCTQIPQQSSCINRTIHIYTIKTGKVINTLNFSQSDDIENLAFSPNSQLLAASGLDGINLWDTSSWEFKGTLFMPKLAGTIISTDFYSNLMFSPDSHLLVSYSTPGEQFYFALWDTEKVEPFIDAVNETSITAGSLTFGTNSQTIDIVLSQSDKNILLRFNIALPTWQKQACNITNRNLDSGEWYYYIHDGSLPHEICTDKPLNS